MEYNFIFQEKEITMKIIVHPTYFPNIEFFSHLLKSKNLTFEINDFYQKQTFRNRTQIYSSNGKLNLVIPVKFSSTKKDKLKDIKICNDTKWQKNHLKSIQIAYRSSPYFEFFEDYFIEIFEKKENFLIDISIKSIEIIFRMLETNLKYNLTDKYQSNYDLASDLRSLSVRKKKVTTNLIQPYTQVFETEHGFISNLSVIDLIFNEGLNSLNYFNKTNT
tara:strand:+ start:2222 stop:2878 length:657 start_codon:yes stop_codon:yes gene_type:complete